LFIFICYIASKYIKKYPNITKKICKTLTYLQWKKAADFSYEISRNTETWKALKLATFCVTSQHGNLEKKAADFSLRHRDSRAGFFVCYWVTLICSPT